MRLDKGQIEVLDDAMADVFSRKTPTERLRIAFGLWSSARVMLTSMLSSQYPKWDRQRIEEEVASRLAHGTVRSITTRR
jgi:hypothetical protein